jgi:hypothetical protein
MLGESPREPFPSPRIDQCIESVRIVNVIRVDYVAGAGTKEEPLTRYVRFYSEDGRLLADSRNGHPFSGGYHVDVQP